MSLAAVRHDVKRVAMPARAKRNARFFKTGKGEYGEGDVFIGVTAPELRIIARMHADLSTTDIKRLLASTIHEERMLALIILTKQYRLRPADIYRLYLSLTKRINNWDLVDISAPRIIGTHLLTRPRTVLDRLARSANIWERRIAIVATLAFIREGELNDTFRITKHLMADRHDLMHKACGWMLREAGKRDEAALRDFLDRHASQMPRTMLRYAIERLSKTRRRHYLAIPRSHL